MTKPTLMLLPGLLCDRAVWAEQVAALSDIAECVVAQYKGLATIPAMAAAALVQAPSRFALAGHSMGGRVALEIMRTAAQRVQRLALLDTGYQGRAEGEAGEREARQRQRLVDIARQAGMRAMGLEWVPPMVHPKRVSDDMFMASVLAMVERQTPENYASHIQALLDRPEAADVLPTIRCPTVLICGREDAWSPLARHEDMARAIPGAQLEAIEQCGHMSTMEQPQAVSAALRRWLERAA